MTSETPYKPVAKELPLLVHVTAPAALPAGYTFEAEINGDPSKLFTCEVVRFRCITHFCQFLTTTSNTTGPALPCIKTFFRIIRHLNHGMLFLLNFKSLLP
jgi:hypothetical protein